MASYAVTPESVIALPGAVITSAYNAGESIEIGDLVYLDESAQTWKKAECGGTAAASRCGGMALSKALAANQPITVCERGPITFSIDGGPPVRSIMILSNVAGQMKDAADANINDEYPCVIGIIGAFRIDLRPLSTGV